MEKFPKESQGVPPLGVPGPGNGLRRPRAVLTSEPLSGHHSLFSFRNAKKKSDLKC